MKKLLLITTLGFILSTSTKAQDFWSWYVDKQDKSLYIELDSNYYIEYANQLHVYSSQYEDTLIYEDFDLEWVYELGNKKEWRQARKTNGSWFEMIWLADADTLFTLKLSNVGEDRKNPWVIGGGEHTIGSEGGFDLFWEDGELNIELYNTMHISDANFLGISHTLVDGIKGYDDLSFYEYYYSMISKREMEQLIELDEPFSFILYNGQEPIYAYDFWPENGEWMIYGAFFNQGERFYNYYSSLEEKLTANPNYFIGGY